MQLQARRFQTRDGMRDQVRSSSAGPERIEYYTIGEMARHFGISLRALRFYEDRGLISPQRHGFTRLYDAQQRMRVQLILKGKKLGFTLTEIRAMMENHGSEPPRDLEQALDSRQIASQIGMLERQRDNLDQAIAELRATASRLETA